MAGVCKQCHYVDTEEFGHQYHYKMHVAGKMKFAHLWSIPWVLVFSDGDPFSPEVPTGVPTQTDRVEKTKKYRKF